jgi:hypothetical protein
MLSKTTITLFVCLLFSTSSIASETSPYQARVDKLLAEAFVVSPNDDEQEVIKKLGAPKKRNVTAVNNKYSNFNDQQIEIFYPGLSILIYTFSDPKHGWSKVSRIDVSQNKWPFKYNLKIGMEKELIKKSLGSPHQTSEVEGVLNWFYFPSDEEPHLQLICTIRGGKLSKLIWSNMP